MLIKFASNIEMFVYVASNHLHLKTHRCITSPSVSINYKCQISFDKFRGTAWDNKPEQQPEEKHIEV